jgi:hypothetical protein
MRGQKVFLMGKKGKVRDSDEGNVGMTSVGEGLIRLGHTHNVAFKGEIFAVEPTTRNDSDNERSK